MASTYSPKLRLELIGAGEQAGLWGTTTNKNIGQLLEQAIAGVTTVELDGLSGNYTLTALDGAPDQSRSAVIKCAYAVVPASGTINLIIPTQTKLYVVRNDCGQIVYVKTSAQSGGVEILDGESTLVFCDGTDAIPGIQTAAVGTLTVSGGGTGVTTFTAGFVKSPGGTGALTTSATVDLASEVTGTLPVNRGGTGNATLTSGRLLIGNGTGNVAVLGGTSTGQVATWDNGAQTWVAATSSSSGTVTSVAVSGGTTGLTVSGSPITTAGTITLGGTLALANGGTGATTATNARTNLGLGTMATQASNNVSITGGSISGVSGLVDTSSTQTITGVKTFSARTIINGTNTASRPLLVGITSAPQTTWNAYFYAQPLGPAIAAHAAAGGSIPLSALIDGSLATSWCQWYTGTTASPTIRGGVDWNGTNVVYSGTSDYRLKENIVPLSNAVTKLKALNPVQFTWKETPAAGLQDGFLAHEFKEVIPNGVIGDKDQVDADGNIKPQTLDASFAIPVLTKALQEAIARIESLEAEVAALKGA